MVSLGDLIELLRTLPPDAVIEDGGGKSPHSYRGDYSQLAFVPCKTTVREMLTAAERAVGDTFFGWKGGEYTMHVFTDVYLAEIGDCGYPICLKCIERSVEKKSDLRP